MADEDKPDKAFDRPSRIGKTSSEADGDHEPIVQSKQRFPAPPSVGHVPDAPNVNVTLPPNPDKPQKGTVAPGAYNRLAVSATAASSFVTPILVLGVGGWYLDQKMHNQTAYLAFGGTVLGFIVGIFALMRVIQQLSR